MEKRGVCLDAFFLRWLHASGRFGTFCVPKCRTIPFFGRFLESCYIAHPRSRAKVSGKPVRGYEIGGKTAFRQEKCCTIRNLPRKSESCNKIRRFLPWLLIPGRFPRHGIRHGLGVRTVGQEAQWRAQGLPIAIVEGGSPSRTVGSCATSSRTLLSVTARAPTASISRA